MAMVLKGLPWKLVCSGSQTIRRSLSLTPVNQLKEIKHNEKDGITTVEGVYIKSPREDYLIKIEPPATSALESEPGMETSLKSKPKEACPLCRLGPLKEKIKHTDVLILSQFIRPNGEVLPRRISGLCGREQKRINWLVQMAQCAGLLQNKHPPYGFKHFNKYYDDEVVLDNFFRRRRMRA